ncbi:hypothetical protein QLL95_gp0687 [Cotonvirus japonicus]|uniref:Uncharacterized protein n=1 Tax=Cotonvirus japonicus TaxID=2811091 RepID=A0ABM7NTK3_9VIRU|nr:hypothetical protein QLL95_gp0687 [Cotonvirus japonicus]BCS83436.1 hypothetical protein [Cotonvirus japonicus]
MSSRTNKTNKNNTTRSSQGQVHNTKKPQTNKNVRTNIVTKNSYQLKVPVHSQSKSIDDSEQTDRQSVGEKFGHIRVVTASFHLLLTFLIRHLKFMSTRDEKTFGCLVAWADKTVKQVSSERNLLQDILHETAKYEINSFSANALRCTQYVNEKDETSYYSAWYKSRNFVPEEVLENNTLTLVDASAVELLDQLAFRLGKVSFNINRNGNCEYDFFVKEEFDKLSDCFNKLKDYLMDNSDSKIDYDDFLEKARRQQIAKQNYYASKANQTPVTVSVTREPSAPRKSTKGKTFDKSSVKPKKLDFEDDKTEESKENKPVEPIVVPAEACKPVVKTISFAETAKKNLVKSSSEPAIMQVEEGVFPDLSDE